MIDKKYENDIYNRNKHLEKRLKNLETEKNLMNKEIKRLENEFNGLRNELDRLRQPPLVVAVIVNINEDMGEITVLASSGTMFVVDASKKALKKKLEPGMFVSLNQRTFAIMDVLSITSEEVWSAKRKIYKIY